MMSFSPSDIRLSRSNGFASCVTSAAAMSSGFADDRRRGSTRGGSHGWFGGPTEMGGAEHDLVPALPVGDATEWI